MLIRYLFLALGGVIASFTALILLLPTPPASGAQGGRALVIDHVHYFDGTAIAGPTRIVMVGGRIVALGEEAPVPSNAKRIEGVGLTALPGLIDAHVHTYGNSRRDAVRFGVTSVIDMFTDPSSLIGAREARESYAATDDAAVFSAGMLATVDGGHGTQFPVTVETLDARSDVQAWVAARVAEGSDFIKLVYMPEWERRPSLDLATARAVIDAAHGAGLQAVAHIATQRSAQELLDAGIDGFVHVFADTPVSDEFLRAAREAGVFVVPTLAVIASVDGQSVGPSLLEHPVLGERVDTLARTSLGQNFGASTSAIFNLDMALANVARLHRAGIPILAGSDAPNPGTAHGITLHGELALLVRAGLSPAQALATATSIPAEHFALTGRGRIEVGARADLLLVSGDPLRQIDATREIHTVVRNGFVAGQEQSATDEGIILPAALSDFDQGLTAPAGLSWTATSDKMMGGSSTAELALQARGNGAGSVLSVRTRVTSAFAYPWAGASLAFTTADQRADITQVKAIRFQVRGTPARYRLMLFEQGSMGTPPSAPFAVSEQWQAVEIPLSAFGPFAASRFVGMAFVSPESSGAYAFDLDDVQLVR